MTGLSAVFFYLFATLAVIAALITITRRDPVTSAFWLIFCFLNVAALFATLSAHFIAVLQILLYAGAIMVFFLFVTMFLGEAGRSTQSPSRLLWLIGLGTVVALGILFTSQLAVVSGPLAATIEGYGGIEGVSKLMLTRYLFAFELTGLLLTVAVIGAVLLARRSAPGMRGAQKERVRKVRRELPLESSTGGRTDA